MTCRRSCRCSWRDGASLGESLRTGGVYVLTGGLGGIATTFATALLRDHGARVALIVRQSPAPGSRQAERLAGLQRLRGEVIVVAADMAQPAEVYTALARVRARFGHIDGVFHAAGIAGRSALHATSPESSTAVFAPKVAGGRALLEALAQDRPDFVVLCSSLAAVEPAQGQGDYAAANAVMDALADATGLPCPVVSIGWNSWRETGAMHDRLSGPAGITEIAGHAWLDRLVRMQDGGFACEGTIREGDHWLSCDHRIDGATVLSGTTLVELVVQSLALAGNAAFLPCRIETIVFVSPVRLDPDETRELHLRFTPASDGTLRFSVKTQIGGQTHVHALGHARAGAPEPPAATSTDLALALPEPGPVPAGDRLELTGRWACAVARNADFARVALNPAFAADLAKHPLHPALFDIATSVLAQGDGLTLMLPLAHEGLSVHRPIPAEVLISATKLAAPPGCLALALVMYDRAGEPVASLNRISFAVPDSAADILEGLLAGIPSEADSANPFAADSLSPEEGLAALLALPLDRGPHIIISGKLSKVGVRWNPSVVEAVSETMVRERPDPQTFVRAVWQAMLGAPAPSDDAHFFEIGGNSLAATRVLARIKDAYGRAPSLRAFFQSPTIAELVRFLEGDGFTAAPSTDGVRPDAPEEEWETGSL